MFDKAIGAFLGAFFAYLFMRFRDVFASIYERQKKNFNALVRLEYLCCENMDSIQNNIWIIDDFSNTSGEALKKGQPVIYGNRLHALPFPDDILIDLVGIDFMNEILSYKVSFTRLNHDIETINVMYDGFKNAFMQGRIDFETYRVNALVTLEKSLQLRNFLEALDDKTIKVGACVRVLLREKRPFLTKIIHFAIRGKVFTKSFSSKVEKEIKLVKSDRDKVIAESKKELEMIKAKLNVGTNGKK